MTGPDGERLCGNCGEPNPVRAKFCLECGSPLNGVAESTNVEHVDLVDQLPQVSSTAGERRTVTVIFADLSGFTAYSEGSDVEDVRAIAQETAARLGDIVERYDGTVDKIIGDCVMAVFGAPKAHEDDPERAVRCAIDMQECVKGNQERFAGLSLSVGLQTGEAMWATVGSDGYTVLGDTVNTAARLQGAAGKGEIVIGKPTYEAVKDIIECEELEPIKAKNKAEPVPAWKALSVKGARVAHKPRLAGLAGRTDELKRLREVWELARTQKRPYGVTILGSAGVGKSRLVSSLTDGLGDAALVLRGRCLPYGEGITYWPVIEIIQQVADIHHDDDRPTVSQKLGDLLYSLQSEDLDELRTMAVALANVIGAPTTPRGTYTATEISKGELHWGLRRILELGSRTVPLVMVMEDLHWAEPTLLELIDYIFESPAEDVPILGICTARPEFMDIGDELLKAGRNRRVLELESLSDSAARDIVTELVGTEDIPADVLDQILQSAGGNPLFLEEIAQMWRESAAADGFTASAVPGGLQALLDSRLDALTSDERRVVATAAVVGEVFWSGTITSLLGSDADLDPILDSLETRDLIRSHETSSVSGEQEYGFKHGLIRDTAYRRLAKGDRAQMHERCGAWMAKLPGGEHEFAEIIAYHLEQACRIADELAFADTLGPRIPAAEALDRAAKRAEARQGMREAERFLARALELLGDSFPETALQLSLRRSRMLFGLGRYEDAQEALATTATRALDLSLLDVACQAKVTLSEIATIFGRATDAHEHVAEAESLARQTKDPELRIRTMWARAHIQDRLDGQPAAVVDTLRTAVALAEEIDNPEFIRDSRWRLGVLHFNNGELEQAELQLQRAMELAKDQGSLRISSWLSAYLGRLRYFRGPRDEAATLLAQANEWLERTGDRYIQVATQVWRAQLALSNDDLRRAIVLLRVAEERGGGGAVAVDVHRHMAETLFRQGRTTEVAEVAQAARAATPQEDQIAVATAAIAEAFAAAAEGDHGEARRHFAQAIPLLETQGGYDDIGEARLAYARLLETIGDHTGATDQLERAREVFERVGATAAVADADGELARLRDLEVGTVTQLKQRERSA
jgi:class 3 adenylate cyclase/tetratricopeptide (TPR) repeat protein